MTMSLTQRAKPLAGPVDRRRLRVAPAGRADEPARSARALEPALDRMLELLERRRLSPIELRILLALRDGDVPASGLADSFDRRPEELRRAAADRKSTRLNSSHLH